ncbi:MAG: hypothetical protein ACOZCE_05285 [Spirochaetota bacterium]
MVLMAVLVMVFMFFLVPAVYGQFMNGGQLCKALDTLFMYTPEEARETLACLGPLLGRYRLVELSLDLVYPVVYSLFLSMVLTALLRNTPLDQKLLWYLPILAWFSDLLENLGIVTMISLYPEVPRPLAAAASLCTSMKWIFVGMSVASSIIFSVYKLVIKRKPQL